MHGALGSCRVGIPLAPARCRARLQRRMDCRAGGTPMSEVVISGRKPQKPRLAVDNEPSVISDAPKLKQLPFINMSTWDDDPVPQRQWAVQDRIPLKQTYLFTGNGAVGK